MIKWCRSRKFSRHKTLEFCAGSGLEVQRKVNVGKRMLSMKKLLFRLQRIILQQPLALRLASIRFLLMVRHGGYEFNVSFHRQLGLSWWTLSRSIV